MISDSSTGSKCRARWAIGSAEQRQQGLAHSNTPVDAQFVARWQAGVVEYLAFDLEHGWKLSADAGRDVPLSEAADSYVRNILEHRVDERSLITPPDPRSQN